MAMSTRADQEKADLIAKAAAETTRLPANQAATVAKFIQDYYAHVPPRDLLGEKPTALYGAALALWKFAAVRKPGQVRLRAYNPRLETDGWHSEHTVIEIVNDDMPFLVDSVNAALNGLDLTVHLIIHPIIASRRDAKGRLLDIVEDGKGALLESFMHVEVAGQSDESLPAIAERLASVLTDVRAAVEDWQPMRARVRDIIESLQAEAGKTADSDAGEVGAFMQWLHDEHFTFIGYRDHDLEGRGKARTLTARTDSGLGILRDPARAVFEGIGEAAGGASSPLMRALVEQPDLLFITKADIRSPIHRPVHLDIIGVKRRDGQGRLVGQRLFVGLFTSAAYNRSPRAIPLLRRKLDMTLARAEFPPASHDGKALLNILETYPRDELLQVSTDHLFRTSIGILNLQERQRVAAFFRADNFGRFMSVLIYIPRDRYTYMLRQRMRAILERAFDAEMGSFKAELGDSPLVRLHMMLRTRTGVIPTYDPDAFEAALVEAARSWSDLLESALNAPLAKYAANVCGAATPTRFRRATRSVSAPTLPSATSSKSRRRSPRA